MESQFSQVPDKATALRLKLSSLVEYTFQIGGIVNHQGYRSRLVVFDATGKILDEVHYDQTGRSVTRKVYEHGNVQKQVNLIDEKVDSQIIFEYDTTGKVIRKLFQLSHDVPWYSIHLHYDTVGRIENEEIIDKDGRM